MEPAIQRRIVALLLLIGQHFFIQQMREAKPMPTLTASTERAPERTLFAQLGPVSLTWASAPYSIRRAYRALPLYSETRSIEH